MPRPAPRLGSSSCPCFARATPMETTVFPVTRKKRGPVAHVPSITEGRSSRSPKCHQTRRALFHRMSQSSSSNSRSIDNHLPEWLLQVIVRRAINDKGTRRWHDSVIPAPLTRSSEWWLSICSLSKFEAQDLMGGSFPPPPHFPPAPCSLFRPSRSPRFNCLPKQREFPALKLDSLG